MGPKKPEKKSQNSLLNYFVVKNIQKQNNLGEDDSQQQQNKSKEKKKEAKISKSKDSKIHKKQQSEPKRQNQHKEIQHDENSRNSQKKPNSRKMSVEDDIQSVSSRQQTPNKRSATKQKTPQKTPQKSPQKTPQKSQIKNKPEPKQQLISNRAINPLVKKSKQKEDQIQKDLENIMIDESSKSSVLTRSRRKSSLNSQTQIEEIKSAKSTPRKQNAGKKRLKKGAKQVEQKKPWQNRKMDKFAKLKDDSDFSASEVDESSEDSNAMNSEDYDQLEEQKSGKKASKKSKNIMNKNFVFEDDKAKEKTKQEGIQKSFSKQQQQKVDKNTTEQKRQQGQQDLLKKKVRKIVNTSDSEDSDEIKETQSHKKQNSNKDRELKEAIKQSKIQFEQEQIQKQKQSQFKKQTLNDDIQNDNKMEEEFKDENFIEEQRKKLNEFSDKKTKDDEQLEMALKMSVQHQTLQKAKSNSNLKKKDATPTKKPNPIKNVQPQQNIKKQSYSMVIEDDSSSDGESNLRKKNKKLTKKIIPSSGPLKPVSKNNNNESQNKNVNKNGFAGLTFVFTGTMPTIQREEAQILVKNHGGRCTSAVSSKTSYLVIGEKLEDGREIQEGSKYRDASTKHAGKVKIINENDFFDLIEEKLGQPISYFTKTEANQDIIQEIRQKYGIQDEDSDYVEEKKVNANHKQTSLWTTFHAPKNIDECVGNKDKIKKLLIWLRDWEEVVIKKTLKKEVPTANFWAAGGGGFPTVSNPNKPAALISGPPGIGKTSCVRIIAKALGYELIETNASDIRNKNGVKGMLGDLISNQTIGFGIYKTIKSSPKTLILMDEVDGMSAGDRGGNQELMKLIDTTKTPIICVCNDRQSSKIRSLANHCYDLEFNKPNSKDIMKRMQQIARKEKLDVDDKTMEELIVRLNSDIRQIINSLQMWTKNKKNMSNNDFKNNLKSFNKDKEVSMTGFDAAKMLLNRETMAPMRLYEKINLFMIDYDTIPLIIQNQYIEAGKVQGKGTIKDLENLTEASESIALGDIMSQNIRNKQMWSLLPNMAIQTAVVPTEVFCKQIAVAKFPAFYGKFSSQKKVYREIRELRQMLGHRITGSRFSVKFDYARPLLNLILSNLKKGKEDLQLALDTMDYYNLNPDSLKEQLLNTQYPKNFDYFKDVETKTKSALTRAWKERNEVNLKKAKNVNKDIFNKKKKIINDNSDDDGQVKTRNLDDIQDDDSFINDGEIDEEYDDDNDDDDYGYDDFKGEKKNNNNKTEKNNKLSKNIHFKPKDSQDDASKQNGKKQRK